MKKTIAIPAVFLALALLAGGILLILNKSEVAPVETAPNSTGEAETAAPSNQTASSDTAEPSGEATLTEPSRASEHTAEWDVEGEKFTAGEYTFTVDGSGMVWLTAYSGSGTDLVLPGSVEARPVAGLGPRTFAGKAVESVVLPDGMTTVGDSAFEGCERLRRITIPETVTEIGCRAFAGTTSLEIAEIPEGVLAIKAETFRGSGVREVRIGYAMELGSLAFADCQQLINVYIPVTTLRISDDCFDGCSRMLIINAAEYSEAFKYAKEHDILAVAVGRDRGY